MSLSAADHHKLKGGWSIFCPQPACGPVMRQSADARLFTHGQEHPSFITSFTAVHRVLRSILKNGTLQRCAKCNCSLSEKHRVHRPALNQLGSLSPCPALAPPRPCTLDRSLMAAQLPSSQSPSLLTASRCAAAPGKRGPIHRFKHVCRCR